jgi:hypothetical protein
MSISGIGGGSSVASTSQDSSSSSGNRYGVLRNKSNDEQDEVIISQEADDLTALRRLFRNELNKLSRMHDAETDTLLAKLESMTEQFQTQSDESTGTIHSLERKVSTLSAKLGRMISGLDRSGGGHMSLRDILRFRQVASLGGGALDKLMSTLGSNENSSLTKNSANTVSLLA